MADISAPTMTDTIACLEPLKKWDQLASQIEHTAADGKSPGFHDLIFRACGLDEGARINSDILRKAVVLAFVLGTIHQSNNR